MGITSALLGMFARSNLRLNPIPGLTRSISSSNSRSRSRSPWLILRPQPEIESGDMVHRLYNVEEDKVSWEGKLRGFGKNSRIVGSSHGWLALYNMSSGCLHLTDPVNDGHEVELPSVNTVFDDWVYRVFISSSTPGDGDCRALMICDGELFFCVPKHSKRWSPVTSPQHSSWRYEDLAYSNTRRTFICLAQCKCPKGASHVVKSFDLSKAAAIANDNDNSNCTKRGFDLSKAAAIANDNDNDNSNCIKRIWKNIESIKAARRIDPKYAMAMRIDPSYTGRCSDFHIFDDEHRHSWPGRSPEESEFKKEECTRFKYLFLDEDSDQVYVVVRHVLPQMMVTKGLDFRMPYKTVDFDVYKIDVERNEIRHEDTLDGLALFVGINHPFALRPRPVGESRLRPDSIYFNDLTDHLSWYYSCHDNKVFDYKSRTFSPCPPDYPIDLREIKQTK